MATFKRYGAVGTGLVSHPDKKPAFVGYRRVLDKTIEADDVVVPDGHRFRKLPDGEVLKETSFLRCCVRPVEQGGEGSLVELPLELPPQNALKAKSAPKGEV